LLSFAPLPVIREWKREVDNGRNPRDIKVGFAQEIVARFHSKPAAEQALADFEARFRQHAIPADMPEITLPAGESGVAIAQVLKQAQLTGSTSGYVFLALPEATQVELAAARGEGGAPT